LLKELPHLFSANEVSERIVSSSVGANLIIYLTTKYHLGAASSAIIIFVYIAAANFLPVCGAIVSDALLGRCLMVTLTLFSCTIVRALNNPLALKQLKFIIFFNLM
jgi:dipeptide/tripeptide permease